VSFIDATPSLENSERIKDDLSQNIFPWLKRRYVESSEASPDDRIIAAFSQTIRALAANLPVASLFPLLDVWRLAIIEPTIAPVTLDPLLEIMTSSSESLSSLPRATLLTLLRLTTNALASSRSKFTWQLVTNVGKRATLTSLLVPALQHSDRLVRVAAASLVFNVSARVQKGRVAKVTEEKGEADWFVLDQEWELELVRAVTEAIAKEGESEDLGELIFFQFFFFSISVTPSQCVVLLPTTRRYEHQTLLTGTPRSAPADCDAGIFDPAVAFLSKSALPVAPGFECEKGVEGQAGGRCKVDSANGDQGVTYGSCGPIMLIGSIPRRGLEDMEDLEGIASDLGEVSCVFYCQE